MWLFYDRSCHSKARLVDKTVVITGGNSGIGKETARDLYKRGARVILACRDGEKAKAAVEEIKKSPTRTDKEQFNGELGELVICKLNLANLASVRECARHLVETEQAIHILINNAGVMMCPYQKTIDGYEMQIQTNHLGHFLLTLLLLPKMQSSTPGCRIINVSSISHDFIAFRGIHIEDLNFEKRSYNSFKSYTQSKLANVIFARELARRFKESEIEGINTYSLHPGVIATELGRNLDSVVFFGANFLFDSFGYIFGKSIVKGAQTTIHCAVDERAGKETGLYYKECRPCNPSYLSKNEQVARELWDLSCELVGLEKHDSILEQLKMISRQQNELTTNA